MTSSKRLTSIHAKTSSVLNLNHSLNVYQPKYEKVVSCWYIEITFKRPQQVYLNQSKKEKYEWIQCSKMLTLVNFKQALLTEIKTRDGNNASIILTRLILSKLNWNQRQHKRLNQDVIFRQNHIYFRQNKLSLLSVIESIFK